MTDLTHSLEGELRLEILRLERRNRQLRAVIGAVVDKMLPPCPHPQRCWGLLTEGGTNPEEAWCVTCRLESLAQGEAR